MTPPFRIGDNNANNYPNSGDSVPSAEGTDNSDTSSGMSSLTNEQMLIKSLRLENEKLRNSTSKSYFINVEEMKPDKVKDGAILNDLTFYIGTMVFKRFKFLPNKQELYNYKKKGALGNVVMSEKILNIPHHKQQLFWTKFAKKASKIITEKRSSVRTSMKKTFIGK